MGFLLPLAITFLVLIAVTLLEICKKNSTAQYYIKFFFLFWWYMGTGALVIPIAIFRPRDSINMWWWSFWVKIGLTKWWFDMDIKKENEEELEYDGPCVIVCNHQSALDQIAILYCWPSQRCTFMAKSSIKWGGTCGIACNLAGIIWVDRGNTEKAKSQTTKECLEYITEKKGKLLIYPEGTRSGNRDEHMLPFKKGAFHIAVQSQVPIIPVVMSGYKNMFSDKMRKFGKVNITIKVLPKIETKGLTADDVTELSNKVRSSMLETYYEISPHMDKAEDLQNVQEKQHLETPKSSPTTQDLKTPDLPQSVPGSKPLETPPSAAEASSPETIVPDTKDTEISKDKNLLESNNEQIKIDESESVKLIDIETNVETQAKDTNRDGCNDNNTSKFISEQSKIENLDKMDDTNESHLPNLDESPTVSQLTESTLLVELSDSNPSDSAAKDVTKVDENDESPSSQASSDSFVFVNSSKIDEEAASLENKSESSLENLGAGDVITAEEVCKEENTPQASENVEDDTPQASENIEDNIEINTEEAKPSDIHVEQPNEDSDNLPNPNPSIAE